MLEDGNERGEMGLREAPPLAALVGGGVHKDCGGVAPKDPIMAALWRQQRVIEVCIGRIIGRKRTMAHRKVAVSCY